MPAVVKIDPKRRLVWSAFFGDVTEQQILTHRELIAAEPHFDPAYAELVDFGDAHFTDVSEAVLKALAEAKSLYNADVPHVVIAPAELPFTLAQRYQQLAKASRPNLFVVRSLAEAWNVLREHGFH